ncbi:MAG: hypothetical protein DMG36_16085 [Acidobacteria bacterium]|nr:MAG: hypothetical protein DMG36_16085 [Acidobacteriota bacterium]
MLHSLFCILLISNVLLSFVEAQARVSAGLTWTASDGSKLTGRILKTVPAPVSISMPWVSYKVVRTSGRGLLSGYTLVQRVWTHAGQAPKKPQRPGEKVEVRFTSEYWFYKQKN